MSSFVSSNCYLFSCFIYFQASFYSLSFYFRIFSLFKLSFMSSRTLGFNLSTLLYFLLVFDVLQALFAFPSLSKLLFLIYAIILLFFLELDLQRLPELALFFFFLLLFFCLVPYIKLDTLIVFLGDFFRLIDFDLPDDSFLCFLLVFLLLGDFFLNFFFFLFFVLDY